MAAGPNTQPSCAPRAPQNTSGFTADARAEVVPAGDEVRGSAPKRRRWVDAVMFVFSTAACKRVGNPRG